MNATPNRVERRRFNDPTPRCTYAAVASRQKLWVFENSLAHGYCVAMGWELLMKEPDGMLFQAPEGFEVHATERLPA